MRILGLDVGDKTIGIAVSDDRGRIALGLTTHHRKSLRDDLLFLQRLVEEYQVSEIVVGLPKNMNGTIGRQGEKVQAFAEKVRAAIAIPLAFWDERLSTVAAERTLLEADLGRKKRKQVVDKLAAVLILQGYLDRRSQSSGASTPENGG
ncbi:MAG: Holliday junction resolvase RuvX [Nitrospirae bacterium]|nr:Holliday junction resolvase RuvX [Nitrospirota bacterium]